MAEIHVNKVKRKDTVSLREKPITVGRSSENDLVLKSTTVSGRHCVIEVVDGGTRLRDLGSPQGTKLNGQRIDADVMLRPGDRISVGSYDITYTDGALRSSAADGTPAANRQGDWLWDKDEDDSAAPIAAIELAKKLDGDRGALDQAARDLKGQRDTLETQAAAFMSRQHMFEQQEAALGELRKTLEHERNAVAVSREELETGRGRHAEEIEQLTEERRQAERQTETRASRIRELEAELADARDQLARERDASEAARRVAATAEARVEKSLESQKDASERASDTNHLVQKIERGVDLLRSAAQRLAATLETVQEIEDVWIDVDERICGLQRQGQVNQAHMHERDQLSSHLEEAHEARDVAVVDLIDVAGRLEVVLHQPRHQQP